MVDGGERRGGDGYPVLESSHEGGSVGRPGLLTRRNCKLGNYLGRFTGPLPTYSEPLLGRERGTAVD